MVKIYLDIALSGKIFEIGKQFKLTASLNQLSKEV